MQVVETLFINLPDGELEVAFEGRNPSTLRHAYHEHKTCGEPKPCRQDQDGEKRAPVNCAVAVVITPNGSRAKGLG